jgi:hypothetical protein
MVFRSVLCFRLVLRWGHGGGGGVVVVGDDEVRLWW